MYHLLSLGSCNIWKSISHKGCGSGHGSRLPASWAWALGFPKPWRRPNKAQLWDGWPWLAYGFGPCLAHHYSWVQKLGGKHMPHRFDDFARRYFWYCVVRRLQHMFISVKLWCTTAINLGWRSERPRRMRIHNTRDVFQLMWRPR